jgi:EF hand
MKKLLILSALAATGLAGIAAAQTTPTDPAMPAPMMKHRGMGKGMGQDANHDGVITRQEALDAAAKRFDRMDTNHDGKIDATEMKAMRDLRQMRGVGGPYGRGDMPPPPGSPDGE